MRMLDISPVAPSWLWKSLPAGRDGRVQCTLENEALKSPKKLFPLILLIKWGKCGVNVGNGSV